MFECVKTLLGECTVLCFFIYLSSDARWVFTGVNNRGEGRERCFWWDDLEACNIKWEWSWVVGGNFKMVFIEEREQGIIFLEVVQMNSKIS